MFVRGDGGLEVFRVQVHRRRDQDSVDVGGEQLLVIPERFDIVRARYVRLGPVDAVRVQIANSSQARVWVLDHQGTHERSPPACPDDAERDGRVSLRPERGFRLNDQQIRSYSGHRGAARDFRHVCSPNSEQPTTCAAGLTSTACVL
jgi:hypothetical protein